MAGKYKVISLNPGNVFGSIGAAGAVKVDHGDFPSYAAAAGVARIVKRTFPERTSLVVLPPPPPQALQSLQAADC